MIVREGIVGTKVLDVGVERDKPLASLYPETSRRLQYMEIAASFYGGTCTGTNYARCVVKLAKELWLEDVADGIWTIEED